MKAWFLVLVVPIAAAGITLVHAPASGTFDPVAVEVPFGRIISGSSIGANNTNASVAIAATLLQTSTDILYLNNTNATSPYFVRFELVGTDNLGLLDLVRVGIDNGTTTDQIIIELGVIIDDDGTLVRLEPASTNTVYVTRSIALGTGGVTFWVYAADDASQSTYVKTRASVELT